MRVYLAFFQTRAAGAGTANYAFWAATLRAGLEEAGHTVLESPTIDWAEGMSFDDPELLRSWRARVWSQALADINRLHAADGIDVFLGYFFPKQIEPSAIREIGRQGIPTVNFFCDNVREFRRAPREYRPFALHWVPESAALTLYRQANLPAIHLPMPAWITPEFRCVPAHEEPIVTFLGSHDRLREDLFGRLAELGAELTICGKGWRRAPATPACTDRRSGSRFANQLSFIRQHGFSGWWRKLTAPRRVPGAKPPERWLGNPVDRAEYVRLTRESAVTIGVNRFDSPRVPPGQIATYSRLRDIEAPMLGACYLTEFAPGLDQLYDLEHEIAVYRTAEELAARIRELRADGERRAAMRRRAQERALREHTIGASFGKIAAALGLRRPMPT